MFLKPSAFTQDVKPLLKQSCSAVFGSATGLTDMLVKHLPLSRAGTATKVRTPALDPACSPLQTICCRTQRRTMSAGSCLLNLLDKAAEDLRFAKYCRHRTSSCSAFGPAASEVVDWGTGRECLTVGDPSRVQRRWQVERLYTGRQDSDIAAHMRACNPAGPLVVHIAKLFPKTDTSAFDAFGRILSGTVKPGDKVLLRKQMHVRTCMLPLSACCRRRLHCSVPSQAFREASRRSVGVAGAGAGRNVHPRGRGGQRSCGGDGCVGVPGALQGVPASRHSRCPSQQRRNYFSVSQDTGCTSMMHLMTCTSTGTEG